MEIKHARLKKNVEGAGTRRVGGWAPRFKQALTQPVFCKECGRHTAKYYWMFSHLRNKIVPFCLECADDVLLGRTSH